ncbi:XdhC family protein [Fulvivirgaceae bacterium BMA10]|uniref:XdhC family protein n=1 Tax=Splendidivirga corallicola TaxID=3051826 RepID=A0ABT8KSM6_9BACT|nr:XdhC family protein [Fulvivirgaceae bacterium BMA10]
MNEFQKIIEKYNQIDFSKQKAALATVVRIEGSSYRRPGARMLMTDDGRWTGAISGGCLEGDAMRRAIGIIREGKPELVTYNTYDDESAMYLGIGLGCNGIIDVLIEPLKGESNHRPVELLKKFVKERKRAVLATIYDRGEGAQCEEGERLMLKDEKVIENTFSNANLQDQVREDMLKIAGTGQSETKQYFSQDAPVAVFLEALNPPIHLMVFGGGYDAIPVAKLAKEIGWQVTVTDDCIAHLSPKRFPTADAVKQVDRKAVLDHLHFDAYTAALLISHNYRYDLAVLEQLLQCDVPYIGLLGPSKRADKLFGELKEKDIKLPPNFEDRIYAPVGMNIGAETPDEIALSILAEIQARFKDRPGNFLKDLDGPIHDEYPNDMKEKVMD